VLALRSYGEYGAETWAVIQAEAEALMAKFADLADRIEALLPPETDGGK
jgi:hypothetical protein